MKVLNNNPADGGDTGGVSGGSDGVEDDGDNGSVSVRGGPGQYTAFHENRGLCSRDHANPIVSPGCFHLHFPPADFSALRNVSRSTIWGFDR